MREVVDIPVTVKMRKGVDDDHLTYLEAGRAAAEEGASAAAAPVAVASNDAAQLQHIVADVVTRDIERLCKGLKRATGRPRGQH